jgi:hypothetical protein
VKNLKDTRPKPKPIYRGCPQRFAGNWPTRSKKVSSKVRVFNLRDQLDLPRTDS